MNLIVKLILLFAMAFSLTAQTPPTTYVLSGAVNQQQVGTGGHTGRQFIEGRTAPADSASVSGPGGMGPRIGHRMWWSTACVHPTFTPATWYAAGQSVAVVFGVVSWQFASGTMPSAAVGHDGLFMDPTNAIIVSPALSQVVTSSPIPSGPFVPSGGIDLFWLYWDIPNDPTIVGQIVNVQALRIDPTDGLFYLSHSWLAMIAQ